eukprot:TRINITY_DN5480_c0_g1_i1.p1 TRINITY_DN5480_c0_g1~~TRINITY_DN5480_c0_g1_i1.p1  ORF type:complete len:1578 (-),score=338.16 TRINITY_DN5480_c0_g1_i1:34-4767(-)
MDDHSDFSATWPTLEELLSLRADTGSETPEAAHVAVVLDEFADIYGESALCHGDKMCAAFDEASGTSVLPNRVCRLPVAVRESALYSDLIDSLAIMIRAALDFPHIVFFLMIAWDAELRETMKECLEPLFRLLSSQTNIIILAPAAEAFDPQSRRFPYMLNSAAFVGAWGSNGVPNPLQPPVSRRLQWVDLPTPAPEMSRAIACRAAELTAQEKCVFRAICAVRRTGSENPDGERRAPRLFPGSQAVVPKNESPHLDLLAFSHHYWQRKAVEFSDLEPQDLLRALPRTNQADISEGVVHNSRVVFSFNDDSFALDLDSGEINGPSERTGLTSHIGNSEFSIIYSGLSPWSQNTPVVALVVRSTSELEFSWLEPLLCGDIGETAAEYRYYGMTVPLLAWLHIAATLASTSGDHLFEAFFTCLKPHLEELPQGAEVCSAVSIDVDTGLVHVQFSSDELELRLNVSEWRLYPPSKRIQHLPWSPHAPSPFLPQPRPAESQWQQFSSTQSTSAEFPPLHAVRLHGVSRVIVLLGSFEPNSLSDSLKRSLSSFSDALICSHTLLELSGPQLVVEMRQVRDIVAAHPQTRFLLLPACQVVFDRRQEANEIYQLDLPGNLTVARMPVTAKQPAWTFPTMLKAAVDLNSEDLHSSIRAILADSGVSLLRTVLSRMLPLGCASALSDLLPQLRSSSFLRRLPETTKQITPEVDSTLQAEDPLMTVAELAGKLQQWGFDEHLSNFRSLPREQVVLVTNEGLQHLIPPEFDRKAILKRLMGAPSLVSSLIPIVGKPNASLLSSEVDISPDTRTLSTTIAPHDSSESLFRHILPNIDPRLVNVALKYCAATGLDHQHLAKTLKKDHQPAKRLLTHVFVHLESVSGLGVDPRTFIELLCACTDPVPHCFASALARESADPRKHFSFAQSVDLLVNAGLIVTSAATGLSVLPAVADALRPQIQIDRRQQASGALSGLDEDIIDEYFETLVPQITALVAELPAPFLTACAERAFQGENYPLTQILADSALRPPIQDVEAELHALRLLAQTAPFQSDFANAIPLWERRVTKAQLFYGQESLQAAEAMEDLFDAFVGLGRPGDAIELAGVLLPALELHFPAPHERLVRILSASAVACTECGRPDDARSFSEDAEAMLLDLTGQAPIELGATAPSAQPPQSKPLEPGEVPRQSVVLRQLAFESSSLGELYHAELTGSQSAQAVFALRVPARQQAPTVAAAAGLHFTSLAPIGFCNDGSHTIELFSAVQGRLSDRLRSPAQPEEQRQWLCQIALGLCYLEERLRPGMFNLSAATVLLDPSGTIKLPPLSVCNLIPPDPQYVAPEVRQGTPASSSSTVFSFGVLCTEVMHAGDSSTRAAIPSMLHNLFKKCVLEDPQKRPTLSELVLALHLVPFDVSGKLPSALATQSLEFDFKIVFNSRNHDAVWPYIETLQRTSKVCAIASDLSTSDTALLRSERVLVFLSREFETSLSCVRELALAGQMKKPLLMIRLPTPIEWKFKWATALSEIPPSKLEPDLIRASLRSALPAPKQPLAFLEEEDPLDPEVPPTGTLLKKARGAELSSSPTEAQSPTDAQAR